MRFSTGYPIQTGKIISEFFNDRFVAGYRTEDTNIFYVIVKNLDGMRCFLINTGGVGEETRYPDILSAFPEVRKDSDDKPGLTACGICCFLMIFLSIPHHKTACAAD
jgi:hypothetical protein